MTHRLASDTGRERLHRPGEPADNAVTTHGCTCGAEVETLDELRDHINARPVPRPTGYCDACHKLHLLYAEGLCFTCWSKRGER